MGKVKRARQKYHAAAAKSKDQTSSVAGDAAPMVIDSNKVEAIFPSEGLFKDVNLTSLNLKQRLNDDDFDARSAITSKSLRGSNMKKKDKRKLRHDFWLKKIDTIQHVRKEEKDRKKRQKTAVVGDMNPLSDTLPTLELLLRDYKSKPTPKESLNTDAKPKAIHKEKKRQKEMMEDISLFQQVLEHPAFQSNPSQTVSEHLQNKLEMEESDN